jgi:predicted HAD superfamily hydrolase
MITKYFISSEFKTALPRWFKYNIAKTKEITVVEVHFIPKTDAVENSALEAKMLNKEFKGVSVHSTMSIMNTEYNNGASDNFICFTNERVNKKFEIITNQFETNMDFWLENDKGEKIEKENIDMLRIELLLTCKT